MMEDDERERICFLCSKRFFIVLMLTLIRASDYICRNLLLECVEFKHKYVAEDEFKAKGIDINETLNKITFSEREEDWSYITYSVTHFLVQIPSGFYSDKYGGRLFILVSLIGGTLINFFTPLLLTQIESHLIVGVTESFLRGFFSGILNATTYSILGHWVPRKESSRLCGMMILGIYFGEMMSNVTVDRIVEYLKDWTAPFYIFGGTHAILSIAWCFFGSSTPDSARHISSVEQLYLKNEMGININHKIKDIPISHIFKSIPVWAMIAITYGRLITLEVETTYIDIYFGEIRKKDALIERLILFLIMTVTTMVIATFADLTVHANYLNHTVLRKFYIDLGCLGPQIFFYASRCVAGYEELTFACVCIGYFYEAFGVVGVRLLPLDLAPNFAGFLCGVVQMPSKIVSVFGYFFIVKKGIMRVIKEVIGFTLITSFVCTLIFCLFGDTSLQHFNRITTRKSTVKTL